MKNFIKIYLEHEKRGKRNTKCGVLETHGKIEGRPNKKVSSTRNG